MTANPWQFVTPLPFDALATPGNGPIAGQTLTYDFNLVNFDWVTWHNYEWQNWVQVDALLTTAIGFLNIKGIWRPLTSYLNGQGVYDPEDSSLLYRAQNTHTSGTDFQADVTAGHWLLAEDFTNYLPLTGGTVTGALTINDALQVGGTVMFDETLDVAGIVTVNNSLRMGIADTTASVFTLQGTGVNNYIDTKSTYINVRDTDFTVTARFEPAGASASNVMSVITREKGDARYLQLAGGTLTGELNLNKDTALGITWESAAGQARGRLYRDTTSNTMAFAVYDGAGGNAAFYRFDNATSMLGGTTSVLRRSDGDARYPQLALTTSQTFAGPITVNGNLRMGPADATSSVLTLQGTAASNYIDHKGAVLNVRDADFVVEARVDPAGTASPAATTIITREKGDLRYGVVSSERYKDTIVDAAIDSIAIIKQYHMRSWNWGGVLPVEDERRGRPGFGNIAEEVAAIFPQGVTYQWEQAADGSDERGRGRRRILGLDVAAHLALYADVLGKIIARVEALEGAR